jgi:ribosomal protein S18 acetylase RimI-like enzyme
MFAPLLIRPASPADRPQLRAVIVDMQEHERRLHPTRLPGEQIADDYLDWTIEKAKTEGVVLVAESEGGFVGFVAGWIEETQSMAETADSNRFGYVSDICVMPAFRGHGIAAQLLERIEQHLRQSGIARVRINALAANSSARASYEKAGYIAYEVLHEKVVADRVESDDSSKGDSP